MNGTRNNLPASQSHSTLASSTSTLDGRHRVRDQDGNNVFASFASQDDESESHGHSRTHSGDIKIATGHVRAMQVTPHPSDAPAVSGARRSSFFGALESFPSAEAVKRGAQPPRPQPHTNGTHANKPLPKIDTIDLNGGPHANRPNPYATAYQKPLPQRFHIPTSAPPSAHPSDATRQRPESFFGVDRRTPSPSRRSQQPVLSNGVIQQSSRSKGKERAMSMPLGSPKPVPPSMPTYDGMPGPHRADMTHERPPSRQSRPSSFYGMDGHLRAASSQTELNRHPSPAPSSSRASVNGQMQSSASASWGRQSTRALSPMPSNYATSVSNVDYASPPVLDHSHLQPGEKAALLSHAKTLELYRSNARKTNDPDVVYDFAIFMLGVAREIQEPSDEGGSSNENRALQRRSFALGRRKVSLATTSASSSASSVINARRSPQLDAAVKDDNDGQQSTSGESDLSDTKKNNLYLEASQMLRKVADRGHVKSQYLLANLYSEGVLNAKGKQDYDRAFPLWVLAAKHGHVDAAFRAGECCENAWGCRRDSAKAVGWFKKAAAAMHPGAMLRLGTAEIKGELGLPRKPREGFKWIKRAAELADVEDDNNAPSEFAVRALHELGLLHEYGIEHVVFVDMDYAAECFARASELGYAPSAYRLGEYYEYGRSGIPQDSALSIHYYNIAAQQDHPDACFALTAWYLIGSPGVLPQSDTEAYLWAKKAAQQDLAKAEYALGYFTEMGIGTPKDARDAMYWFERAAEHGDKRAEARLRAASGNPDQQSEFFGQVASAATGTKKHRFAREQVRRQIQDGASTKTSKDGDCIIS